jgi:hypothetical protein
MIAEPRLAMYIHVMEARLDGLDKEVRRFQAQTEKQIPSASASLGVGMTTIKYCLRADCHS